MKSPSERSTEWADEHMKQLQASVMRRHRVMREQFKPTPEHVEQQQYDAETDRLRKFIQGQQATERKTA